MPEELLESAEVDGAEGFRAFTALKLPLTRYHIGCVPLIQLTSAFRECGTVFALTGGAPDASSSACRR